MCVACDWLVASALGVRASFRVVVCPRVCCFTNNHQSIACGKQSKDKTLQLCLKRQNASTLSFAQTGGYARTARSKLQLSPGRVRPRAQRQKEKRHQRFNQQPQCRHNEPGRRRPSEVCLPSRGPSNVIKHRLDDQTVRITTAHIRQHCLTETGANNSLAGACA